MRHLVVIWLSNVAALFVASVFVDGVDYSHQISTLLIAGAVFGVVNLLVKPAVTFLALPVIAATFGIALFFINLLMLYITTWVVGSFHIERFLDAVWATLVIWAVNVVLSIWTRRSARRRR